MRRLQLRVDLRHFAPRFSQSKPKLTKQPFPLPTKGGLEETEMPDCDAKGLFSGNHNTPREDQGVARMACWGT